eukprot:3836307-Amphidinium_carterae.1
MEMRGVELADLCIPDLMQLCNISVTSLSCRGDHAYKYNTCAAARAKAGCVCAASPRATASLTMQHSTEIARFPIPASWGVSEPLGDCGGEQNWPIARQHGTSYPADSMEPLLAIL